MQQVWYRRIYPLGCVPQYLLLPALLWLSVAIFISSKFSKWEPKTFQICLYQALDLIHIVVHTSLGWSVNMFNAYDCFWNCKILPFVTAWWKMVDTESTTIRVPWGGRNYTSYIHSSHFHSLSDLNGFFFLCSNIQSRKNCREVFLFIFLFTSK